jgi:hypothetical protein
MRRTAIFIVAICAAAGASSVLLGAAGARPAQAELDHIVGRVNDRIITQSDVRQARMLRLVDDPSSDAATRVCLENRLLILGEIARSAPVATPTPEDVAARREAWERAVGGRDRARLLLSQMGMSDGVLQAWFRDDGRVDAYLDRQFGSLPGAERSRATADWLARLRQRAGLK